MHYLLLTSFLAMISPANMYNPRYFSVFFFLCQSVSHAIVAYRFTHLQKGWFDLWPENIVMIFFYFLILLTMYVVFGPTMVNNKIRKLKITLKKSLYSEFIKILNNVLCVNKIWKSHRPRFDSSLCATISLFAVETLFARFLHIHV